MQTFYSTYKLDRRSGASRKLFLNLMTQFYLNDVTNLQQLTSYSTTSCPTTWRSYRDRRLLWRHFTLCIARRIQGGAKMSQEGAK